MVKKVIQNRIMVFGTFDGLHLGHLNFFKQARNLKPFSFLIVSIARDKNVFKIKGVYPDLSEHKRALLVKHSGLANRVVLGGVNNPLPHILKEKPDIIAFGYDQKHYVKDLKKKLKAKGLLVKTFRLKPYKKHIFKNHLLKKRVGV